MIRLSSVIEQFEAGFLAQYGSTLLPSQRKALSAIKQCRSSHSPLMKVSCSDCDQFSYVPQEVNCR